MIPIFIAAYLLRQAWAVASIAPAVPPFGLVPTVGSQALALHESTAAIRKTLAVAGAPRVVASVEDPLCSLEVADMDPSQILQTLSAQTHKNLVLLSKADAKLSIRLIKVPLSEMLEHICAMCDLAYLKIGGTYVIAPPERMKTAYPKEWAALHPEAAAASKPEVATATYSANFVTASEIAKTLEKVYTGKDVVFLAGPNPSSPEITTQDSAKATGTSTLVMSKPDTGESVSRLLIISGPRDVVDSALAMAKELDQPRRQVLIEVTIRDISNDALTDIGVTWDFGGVDINEQPGKGMQFGRFTRTPLSISTTLNALDKSGKSKLLASPNVSVLDGERAFVLIGDRINFPVLVGYSQNNAPIFSKEEERVGIYLQVAASIAQNGEVTLSLYPQVSTISGFLEVNGASYPQISTREAQTTVRIPSGQTLVMGGLFRDEDLVSNQKVPLLSQIPLLGAIFQHRKVTKTKSQVIITVTPRVISQNP